MARNGLPAAVQHLIEQHFDSGADVDALLLLRRERRSWTADAVARELRIDGDQAAGILTRLRRTGLLRAVDGGAYRFEPRDPDDADAAARLAQLYPAYRLAVVSQIYARPSGPVRDGH